MRNIINDSEMIKNRFDKKWPTKPMNSSAISVFLRSQLSLRKEKLLFKLSDAITTTDPIEGD